MEKFLSLSAAYDRLGRAMFGNAYIDRLTDKEEWILEQVGPAERLSSHQPGLIFRDRHPLPWPHPAISPVEAQQAIQRLHLQERQEGQMEDWLDARRIARDAADGVHRLSFERELARSFPSSTVSAAPVPTEEGPRIWLLKELLRRKASNEPRNRDAMVIALRAAFFGLKWNAAVELYKSAPEELRGKKTGRPRTSTYPREKSGRK